ncbi:MAG: hypothetical protein ACYCW6_13210 [Candidatus Xenobia bacterium]
MSDDDQAWMKNELERNLGSANRFAGWRKAAARGERFTMEWGDVSMTPAIRQGDCLEMMGVPLREVREQHLVCFQKGADAVVRRVVRRVHKSGEDAFMVRREQGGPEEEVPGNAIFGRVIGITRGSQPVWADAAANRKKGSDDALQAIMDLAQRWLDKLRRK